MTVDITADIVIYKDANVINDSYTGCNDQHK